MLTKASLQRPSISVHITCTTMCKDTMNTTSKPENRERCYNPSCSSPWNTLNAQAFKYKCRREETLGAASKKQSGRRLTPAGRNICFALLRAETAENDVGEARRSSEIIKNLKRQAPKNM